MSQSVDCIAEDSWQTSPCESWGDKNSKMAHLKDVVLGSCGDAKYCSHCQYEWGDLLPYPFFLIPLFPSNPMLIPTSLQYRTNEVTKSHSSVYLISPATLSVFTQYHFGVFLHPLTTFSAKAQSTDTFWMHWMQGSLESLCVGEWQNVMLFFPPC